MSKFFVKFKIALKQNLIAFLLVFRGFLEIFCSSSSGHPKVSYEYFRSCFYFEAIQGSGVFFTRLILSW